MKKIVEAVGYYSNAKNVYFRPQADIQFRHSTLYPASI